ncbi:hypothetical protein [Marinobacter salarius]|uniref:hypothetical protein n=1 Tax=Marinobacter salarius TaxID=1420917 RepID=UPI0025A3CB81|nr:hypothetical protein [Marinobacter salarius]MDM8181277.1 hypothetical protein [Marinobacter salarius]|tara:strand:+ start:961 stop:1368 length:408 start_codon:yes stop_codon:yes gene_type:complete
MSKWDEIKSRLEHLGGSVELLAGGHKLSLMKLHDRKRIFVRVYVDDLVKMEWTEAKDEQPVHSEGRFWRPMKRAAYPKKVYTSAKRALGKKEADRMVTPRVIGFVPDFGTEGAAVAHLKKHFPDLEILEPKEPKA